jgi:hypothetical protein
VPLEAGRLLTLLSWLIGLGALVVLVLIVRRSARSDLLRTPIIAAAVVVSPVVLNGGFAFHATTGMDTTLAILCNTTLIQPFQGNSVTHPTCCRAARGAKSQEVRDEGRAC